MGTAQMQGPLWGAHARDWAECAEPASRPLYEAVFTALGITAGLRLLDAGCGAGLAASLAAERGAQVTGLDASEDLLAIARERVPAGDFRAGDLESLPYPDQTFDIVTGFNSFQFAGDPHAAIREARRVLQPGGRVGLAFWGRPEDCQTSTVVAAIVKLLPPPPPAPADALPPIQFSQPGQLDAWVELAGLQPIDGGEVACPFVFHDLETAIRALSAPGPMIRAAQHAGSEALRRVLVDALTPYQTGDGGYCMHNRFRYIIAASPR